MRTSIISLMLLLSAVIMYSMGMRYSYRLIAWSSDGNYAFLKSHGYGPEGGSISTYIITGGADFKSDKFIVHNDLSNGSGTKRKDMIDRKSYNEAIENLTRTLKQRGFTGVFVKRDFMNIFGDRTESIDIAAQQFPPDKFIFKETDGNYSFENIMLKIENRNLQMYKDSKQIKTFEDIFYGDRKITMYPYINPQKNFIIIFTITDIGYEYPAILIRIHSDNSIVLYKLL